MNNEKIGLVGYSCNSGLGELNRQVATHIPQVVKWLVKPQRPLGVAPTPSHVQECIGRNNKYPVDFFDDVDTVLFFEVQFYPHLAKTMKARGKRVVCIPMLEWTPQWNKATSEWTKYVDLWICPTKHCYDTLSAEGFPCELMLWPYDLDRFTYQPSKTCEQFLFIEAYGGFKGRKGSSVVKRAKELWPEFPLLVKTFMNPNTWPAGTQVVHPGKDNLQLYSQGDVLIYPAKCDGIGLQPHEAMVAGMPVVVTEGRPWGEQPALARINSTHSKKTIGAGRRMDWYEASPQHLVDVCKRLHGTDVSEDARIGRAWAEAHSWAIQGSKLTEMILKGAELDS